jgi:hypothetical protein
MMQRAKGLTDEPPFEQTPEKTHAIPQGRAPSLLQATNGGNEDTPDKEKEDGKAKDDEENGDRENASTVPSNVIPIQSKAKAKPTADYSDWVTVEKRRVSEGVYAHYVRVKDDAGQKKVGLIDYISITDFNKRFSRKAKYYAAYKAQLVAIYKAQTLRASQRTFSDSSGAL